MSSSCVMFVSEFEFPIVERCQYNRGDFLISQHLSKYALFQKPPKNKVLLNKQQLSNKWAWKFQNIKQQRASNEK